MLGSKCDLKMHVRNEGYSLPYKSGAPKPRFLTTSQLSGNFNSLYLPKETRYTILYIIGQMRWQLPVVSYSVSQFHELWSTNGLKLDLHFYPTSVNSAFQVVARLRRRRPANGTQPNFAKRWTAGRAVESVEKLGPPKKWEQKTFTFVRFSTTSTFYGEYLVNETRHKDRSSALESSRGLLYHLKIS